MPRLVGYTERMPVDLGMIVEMKHGTATMLFWPTNLPAEKLEGTGLVPQGESLYPRDGSWLIVDISIDRPDVEVEVVVGQKRGYRFCGPWMRGQRMDLLSVLHDALLEGRSSGETLAAVRAELEQSKGMSIPLIVPVRQTCAAYARLLPNAPEGWATVHFRTIVRREVQ